MLETLFTYLTVEHDWRFVVLASTICVLASAVAISLFQRAQSTIGRERIVWLSLDAVAGGFGIWATHFIAMLAYGPTLGASYDLMLTVLSLALAILVGGAGLVLAERKSSTYNAIFGGIVVGLGIAVTHFTGIAALDLPGRFIRAPGIVVAAVLLGTVFAALAMFAAARRNNWRSTLISTMLLAIAVISTHFMAVRSVIFQPGPPPFTGDAYLSPVSLSLLVAGVTVAILSACLVAALSDRQAKQRLSQQKRLLDTALENMSQGLCMYQADGRALLFNDRYVKLMGMSAASLKDLSLIELLKQRKLDGELEEDPDEFCAMVLADMQQGKSTDRLLVNSSGRTLRVVEQPMDGGGWIATFEDITQWQRAQEQIAHMARHDALTSLPNRRLFQEQLELAVRRLTRNERVTVLCLDLDYFKEVNDALGHSVGDDLLVEVAQRLSNCMREGDTVSRLGGDEFAIVQVGKDLSASAASAFAGRLIEIVSAPYDIQGHQVNIGASIGISVAPDDGIRPDQLLKNGDMALYRAKADGRGAYRFFEAGMDSRAQARRSMELDLRTALAREEFEVYYQPIFDLQADSIICFEALVRWIHPIRGLTLPGDFIPLAEESGLIVQIGDWVLRKACRDAVGWSQDVSVAVNVSPVQFKNRNFISSVESALTASGLDPRRLELEITESVLLQDSETTLATLHTLRDFRVKISMDDFGTGYSSLGYLRSFPFDKIKIDRSFVRELVTRGDSMAIVRAVAGIGKSLGISIIAEGVETNEQLALLRCEGCTEVQGFLFNVPERAEAVENMLARGRLRVVA